MGQNLDRVGCFRADGMRLLPFWNGWIFSAGLMFFFAALAAVGAAMWIFTTEGTRVRNALALAVAGTLAASVAL